MALAPGTRIGPYTLTTPLGAGGMGEVYRARDTKLDRNVALKILPPAFSEDADRVARFRREAKTLAALNHPHIAQIYGLEEAASSTGAGPAVAALVMELVEGEDLAARIRRGPVPVDEALAIARQIADALAAAHEQGIVHRDLKPANVKVRPDGTVKVLDFGLAKAVEPAGGAAGDATASPTITSPAMTAAGMILGTAAYMAPEQAKGRPVDRRADLWAFGCVLYELLTGERAFKGEDVTDTIAAVVSKEPDWTALPASTPAAIRTLLRRCLTKDRARRLDSAAAARLDLDDVSSAVESVATSAPSRSRVSSWVAAAISLVSLVAAGLAWVRSPAVPDQPVVRFTVPVPAELNLRASQGGQALVVAPDGSSIIHTAEGAGLLARWRFDRGEFETLSVRGTAPFFSPDSRSVGVFTDGKLKTVALDSGAARTICDAVPSRGTWGDDGTIVFSNASGLFRVGEGGGTPQPIGPTDRLRGLTGVQPHYLPGSKAVLLAGGTPEERRIQVLTIADGAIHDLTPGTNPLYTAQGDVLFIHEGTLWSAPLDSANWRLTAPPVPVLDEVRTPSIGAALVSISTNGTLVFASTAERRSTIVWLDRQGRTSPALPEPGAFGEPRLSRDGRRLVTWEAGVEGSDLWVYDMERGTRLRLGAAGGFGRARITPDGTRVAFQRELEMFTMPTDGSGGAERLLASPRQQYPDACTPDGSTLIFNVGQESRDLWAFTPGKEPLQLTSSPYSERSGSVSPDGRWLLFASNESGRDEIYVQPYPGPGPKVAISTAGGWQPAWSYDGREIFYRQDDVMMAVTVGADPTRAGQPVKLFDFPRAQYDGDPNRVQYDVAADGRFLAVRTEEDATGEGIHVVLNWFTELRRRAASTPR